MAEAIRTTQAPEAKGHYPQAVRVGNLLFISGQLPFTADGHRVVTGSITRNGTSAGQRSRYRGSRRGKDRGHRAVYDLCQQDRALVEGQRRLRDFLCRRSRAASSAVVPVGDLHYGAHVEIQEITFLNRH